VSVVGEKSKAFAIRVVKVYKYLQTEKKETILSRQLLRSGTSIGANLAESACAISRSDFLSKVYIALKETAETLYWLELLYETDYLTRAQYQSLRSDAEELRKILSATTKTMKETV
jgi:four helix bundle protein